MRPRTWSVQGEVRVKMGEAGGLSPTVKLLMMGDEHSDDEGSERENVHHDV